MKIFDFQGSLQSSKSHLNRALILQSYHPSLHIKGASDSEDVLHLKKALALDQKELQVGDGGTTFRFLAFRLSRKAGEWKLMGSKRLFERPQAEIQKILGQLGVQSQILDSSMVIRSQGWKSLPVLKVEASVSSQFISGVLLNSWGLPFDLTIELGQDRVSEGYLDFTLQLLRDSGMEIMKSGPRIKVPAHQKIQVDEIQIEQDLSSAFVVAALAAARGRCVLKPFHFKSLQPDIYFLELFKEMQIPMRFENDQLIVEKAGDLQPITTSLRNSPDLFPVLCVLLSRAQGVSEILETPQLVFKESNRLKKTGELLKLMKVQHELFPSGIRIFGPCQHHHEFFEFDPDQDHRLAFAAALAKSMGYRMKILNPQVVNKSFPQFWELIGGGPG